MTKPCCSVSFVFFAFFSSRRDAKRNVLRLQRKMENFCQVRVIKSQLIIPDLKYEITSENVWPDINTSGPTGSPKAKERQEDKVFCIYVYVYFVYVCGRVRTCACEHRCVRALGAVREEENRREECDAYVYMFDLSVYVCVTVCVFSFLRWEPQGKEKQFEK